MTLSSAVIYAVPCPHCGNNTPQTVHWLTTHNNMTCDECGRTVNLEGGEIGTIIQGLAQFCARTRTSLGKRF